MHGNLYPEKTTERDVIDIQCELTRLVGEAESASDTVSVKALLRAKMEIAEGRVA